MAQNRSVITSPSEEEAAEVEQQRIYFFARHCWPIKANLAPSGRCTWGDVFKRHSGMSLHEYSEHARKLKLRTKYGIPDKLP